MSTLRDTLTQEEIEFLANPKFNGDQMRVIRLSFKSGLSLEQVKKFAKPECDIFYMEDFFLGYLWGLPEEAIKFYVNTKLEIGDKDEVPTLCTRTVFCKPVSYKPQTILRIALLKGLTVSEIKLATQRFLSQNGPQSGSLKSTLEELVTDRKARAKVRSLINLSTELKESWIKSTPEAKCGKKSFTL